MASNKLRILVLDDNPNDLLLIERELTAKGYLVDLASNPVLLLEKLATTHNDYDIVILDYFLGTSQTGIDILKEIKKVYPHLPTILVTSAGNDFATESVIAGAYRYITKPIDFDELSLAINFAVTYQNAHPNNNDRFLQILHELSTAINLDMKLDSILNSIADHLLQLIDSSRVWLVTLEVQKGTVPHRIYRGYDDEINHFLTIENLMQILNHTSIVAKETLKIEGNSDDTSKEFEIFAFEKCLNYVSIVVSPITIENAIIGLLSVAKQNSPITKQEILHIDMLAKQCGNAVGVSKKHQLINSFTKASEIALSKHEPNEILELLVRQACESLNADWASIVLMSNGKPAVLATAGLPANNVSLNYIRSKGHSAYIIDHNVVVSIENIDKYNPNEYEGIEINPRTLAEGYKSIHGVPVNIRDETVGVIWLHYQAPRLLSTEEKSRFQIFINQTALVYDNARQLQNLHKIQKATQNIASLMNLGEADDTLTQVVDVIKHTVGCDVVALFTYNPDAGRLHHPPILVGAEKPELAQQTSKVSKNSIVYKMLDKDSIYVVPNTKLDSQFSGRPFTIREGIESVVVCPLRAHGKKVGVLFLNYRQLHRFTTYESDSIVIFSNQLATLIRNRHEYLRQRRRVQALKSIYDAGNLTLMSGTELTVGQILDEIAKQAIAIVGLEPDQTHIHRCLSHVGTVEGANLIFRSAFPRERTLQAIARQVGLVINLNHLPSPSTIAAEAIAKRQTLNILNVDNAQQFVRIDYKTKSQLSVPIIIQDRVLGVISIEHPAYDAFDDEDIKNVEALATWAASAIKLTSLHDVIDKVNQTSIMGNPQRTQEMLADGIKEVTKCDLVVLYRYDNLIDRLYYPPTRTTLRNPIAVDQSLHNVPHPSVMTVMGIDSYYIIRDSETDEYFKNNDFVKQEGIKSGIAFPLIVGARKHGILFLNYYSYHEFSQDEINIISLLATHSAVAMYNISLLYREEHAKQRANTLRDISIAVTSKSDLKSVGETILSELKRVVDYNKATMQLIRRGEFRELVAKNFPDDLVSEYLLRPLSEDDLVRNIVDSGEICVVPSTEDNDEWSDELEETHDVASWIGIPLVYHNEVTGFITLDHIQPNFYSNIHKELLIPFANQAAFAIGNARLHSESKALNQVMQTINLMGREIAYQAIEELNLQKLFEFIHECFNELFPDAENYFIAMFDRSINEIAFPLVVDNQIKVPPEGEWKPRKPSNGITEYILRNSCSVLLPEKGISIPMWLKKHNVRQFGQMAKSWAGVPLIVGEHPIGVIAVQDYTDLHEFDESILEILNAFASQIAVAIEYINSRTLFNDLVKFITELYRVREEDEIIIQVVFRLTEMLGCDAAGVCMLENDRLLVKEVFSRQDTIICQQGTWVPRGDEIVWEAIDSRSIAVGKISYKTDSKLRFCNTVTSEIAAPLFRDNQVIGVLKIENIDWRQLQDRKIWINTLVELFADVASASLSMAHYAAQERRVREFLTLADSVIVGGALARSVLHELNNGLTTVDNLLFEITESLQVLQGLKGQNQLLKLLSDARDHLESVSVDPRVVAFSGRLQPTYKSVPFNKIVQETLEFIDSVLTKQKISHECHYDQKLGQAPLVYVDESQIRQVIINLVLNAIDAYHGEGVRRPTENQKGKVDKNKIGKLVIRTVATKDGARLEIEDFASGISSTIAPHLFEPFVTSKQDGAGLGLYVSRIIIEGNHKGKIYFQSKNLGTIFVFTLPFENDQ